jgi:RNA polymerase sigma-70 factor (ECF subfamily)
MADQLHGPDGPAMRRLQRAFAEAEPTTELPEVLWRAATYMAALRDADAQGNRVAAWAAERVHSAAVPGRPVSDANSTPPPGSDLPAELAGALGGFRPTGHDLTAADLAAARRREPTAVSRVYAAHAPALLRFFVAAVGDRHAAEDLTGTVFAASIEALPGFRGPVDELGGWLLRIARHDLFDYRRRQARARMEPLQDVLREAEPLQDVPREAAAAAGADDPVELAPARIEPSRLLAALPQLPAEQREVLLLRIAAGLTAPQVAAVLNRTTRAVKTLQHRGLASLARLPGRRDPAEGAQSPYPSPGSQRSTKQQQNPEGQAPPDQTL